MNLTKILLIATLVGMLTSLSPAVGQAEETFTDGFEEGIRPEFWSFWAIQPEFVVDDSQGYVELSNPYGGDGWGTFEDIGICFKGRLHGDFDVSVEFSELLLEHPDPGLGCDAANEANLGVFFGGQDISVERRFYAYEGQTIVSWVGPPDEWWGSQPSEASSGIMRIVRTGASVTTSVNGQTVINETFNEAPVTGTCLRLANWGGVGKVSVRFDNFSITADSIEFPVAEGWRRHVVTTTQNNGGGSALAFDATGLEAAIAYTDWDSGELKVVRGAEDGPIWLWGTPEVAAPGGQRLDLSYDACGDLWLSYLELGRKGTVNLAHWSAVDDAWTLHNLDTGITGSYTSLASPQGQCGQPSMVYRLRPKNLYEVKFAEAGTPPAVVESGRECKGYSSLGYAPNGDPTVAYSFLDQDGSLSVRLNTRSSGVWTPETVVDHPGTGIYGVDLAYQNGLPVIAYTGRSTEPLFFCEQQGSWQCSALNDKGMSRPSIVVNDDTDIVTVAAVKWDSMWVYSRPFQDTYWFAERFGKAATGDAAIDPTGTAAYSFWLGPELYLAFRHPGTCTSAHHCDDANPCSIDTCSATTGLCEFAFEPDGTQCGPSDEVCCSGQCVARYALNEDCDDGDECTTDQYVPGGSAPCSAFCQHEEIPGCGGGCLIKGEPCTTGDECCSGLCHPVKNTCK